METIYRFVLREKIPLLIAIIIMVQNPFWPYWHHAALISFFFIFILFVVLNKEDRVFISYEFRLPFILLCLFYVVLPVVRGGMHLSNLFYILCFIIAYNFTKEESEKAYTYVTKIVAVVLSVSLPAWLLHTTGIIHFPVISLIDLSSVKVQGADEGGVVMENYFFFVMYEGLEKYRFYSVFDEPGVLGTLGAYLLFAAKYDLSKWYNLVIFLGCLFTFSLAFYIISFLGYLYYSTRSPRKFMLLITITIIIGFFVYGFLMENELFVEKVINRSGNLSESLDSRTGDSVKYFLENASFLTYLFGIGVSRMSELDLLQGASYKLFIVENGFLALLALVYAFYKINPRINRDILVFNLLFWASFLQRPTSFTAWQILIFAVITRVLMSDEFEEVYYEESTKESDVVESL